MKFAHSGLLTLATLLVLTPAFAAQVYTDSDPDVDLTKFRTYVWKVKTPAARADVQVWLVAAIDRELQAKGMQRVEEADADLHLVTVAYAQIEAGIRGNYVQPQTWYVGFVTAYATDTTTGNLLVDFIDPRTERPVWRAVAKDAITDKGQTPQKMDKTIQKKIDKIARKMFRDFPSR